MTEFRYEHKLVCTRQVDEYTDKDWEPTPHTNPVLSYALATPTTYVWMRRRKIDHGST